MTQRQLVKAQALKVSRMKQQVQKHYAEHERMRDALKVEQAKLVELKRN
jgi:hypothetical protein